MEFKELYHSILKEYPDILTVEDMSKALGISTKTGYKLLRNNKISSMRIGKSYRIAKVHLQLFLNKIELPIILASFYGLRRSEVLGLKWDAIDFQRNTITIQHTYTSCDIDGSIIEVAADTTKTKSSRRTLPLIPQFRDILLEKLEQQEEYKRVCGRCYNKKYIDYICVDEMGNIIKPNYVTCSFSDLLKKYGLRHIRFHDLRHTCASLLLNNGIPMKQIQEWLGHSDFATTANIYAHLECNSKLTSAQAMLSGMSGALVAIK